MPEGWLRLVLAWIGLLLLLVLEFGLSHLQMPAHARPVLIVVAIAMLAIVAFCFMHVGSGPTVVRGFAVMGLFWMIILLGLGSMDAMTRMQYFTTVDRPR